MQLNIKLAWEYNLLRLILLHFFSPALEWNKQYGKGVVRSTVSAIQNLHSTFFFFCATFFYSFSFARFFFSFTILLLFSATLTVGSCRIKSVLHVRKNAVVNIVINVISNRRCRKWPSERFIEPVTHLFFPSDMSISQGEGSRRVHWHKLFESMIVCHVLLWKTSRVFILGSNINLHLLCFIPYNTPYR